MKNKTIIFSAVLLICAYLFSASACAFEITPLRASDYITRHDAYVSSSGRGVVKINFDINARGTMEEVGATTIYFYEKDGSTTRRVATYSYTNAMYQSSMMGYNTSFKKSSVTYNGTAGLQYYAIVCLKAENAAGSDTRSKTTTTITAT